MFLSPPSPLSPIYSAALLYTPLIAAVHDTLCLPHTFWTRRGEQLFLSGVYRSAAEYIEESGISGKYRAKINRGTKKGSGGFDYWRSQFSKGFDHDTTKIKYAYNWTENHSFRLDLQKSKFDFSVDSSFKYWKHIAELDLNFWGQYHIKSCFPPMKQTESILLFHWRDWKYKSA